MPAEQRHLRPIEGGIVTCIGCKDSTERDGLNQRLVLYDVMEVVMDPILGGGSLKEVPTGNRRLEPCRLCGGSGKFQR